MKWSVFVSYWQVPSYFSTLGLDVLLEEHAVIITFHPTSAVGSSVIMHCAVR